MGEAVGLGQRDVVAGAQRGDDVADERGVQEGRVHAGDEHDVGAIVQRCQARGDPLQRAAGLEGIVGQLGSRRQRGQRLAGGAHDDDRSVDLARDEADRVAQERRAMPVQPGLGSSHPRGPAAGEHDRGGDGGAHASSASVNARSASSPKSQNRASCTSGCASRAARVAAIAVAAASSSG